MSDGPTSDGPKTDAPKTDGPAAAAAESAAPMPDPAARPWIAQLALALVVLVAAGGLAAWWIYTKPSTKRHSRERQPTPVRVAVVHPQPQPIAVTAHGTVLPSRTVQLRPQVRGAVIAIHPQLIPGSVLKAGETLVQIDPRDYELEVERLAAELVSAQSALQLEQGNQEIARREYELLGDLGKGGDASLALRKPQLAAAQAAVQAAESRLGAARLQLERTKVTVPFDAVVRAKSVTLGTQVSESSVLAELAGIATWWVEVALPVSDLRWIRRFEQAQGRLPDAAVVDRTAWGPGASRQGRVARIAADLQPEGRLARLFVSVNDPLARTEAGEGQPRLLIDAWVEVRLAAGALPGAVAIDPVWLRNGREVWIRTPAGTLEIRPVQPVFRDAERVLIAEGLHDGEAVVTSDLAAAVPGMKLRVLQDAPPPRTAQDGR